MTSATAPPQEPAPDAGTQYLPAVPSLDSLSYDDLVVLCQQVGSGTQWLIGDAALQVETRYRQHSLERFARDIGVNYSTLRTCAQVAGAFPGKVRRRTISFGVYVEFAGLPEADRLALIAQTDAWTVAQARREARKLSAPPGKVIQARPQAAPPEDIDAMAMNFTAPQNAAEPASEVADPGRQPYTAQAPDSPAQTASAPQEASGDAWWRRELRKERRIQKVLREQLADEQREHNRLRQRKADLDGEIAAKDTEIARLRDDNDQLGQRNAKLRTELDERDKLIACLRQDLSEHEALVEELKTAQHGDRVRIERLTGLLNRAEQELDELKHGPGGSPGGSNPFAEENFPLNSETAVSPA
jgi:hypothetical protein